MHAGVSHQLREDTGSISGAGSMHTCVYPCTYVCVCVDIGSMHTCVHHVCVDVSAGQVACIHVCIHVCICVCIYIYIQVACIHVCIHVCVCVCRCVSGAGSMHTRVYPCMYAYVCVYVGV